MLWANAHRCGESSAGNCVVVALIDGYDSRMSHTRAQSARQLFITCLAVACTMTMPAWHVSASDPPQTTQGTRLKTNPAAVLSMLRREAQTWHRDRTLPRDTSNFAQDRQLAMDDVEVIRLLGRTLHDHTVIDAYIKWQLLSFEPDLSSLTTHDYAVILSHLPALEPMPGPADATNRRAAAALHQMQAQRAQEKAAARANAMPAGDRFDVPGNVRGGVPAGSAPTISVVQEGAVLDVEATVSPSDPRYVTMTTRASTATVVDIRTVPVVAAGNAVRVAGRDQLIAALPQAGGVQLVAMFTDLRDRLAAGDASFAPAAVQLEVATREVGRSIDINDDLRAQMLDWTAALGMMATPVYQTQPIEGTFSEKLQVKWHRIDPSLVEKLQRNLTEPQDQSPSDQPQDSAEDPAP